MRGKYSGESMFILLLIGIGCIVKTFILLLIISITLFCIKQCNKIEKEKEKNEFIHESDCIL